MKERIHTIPINDALPPGQGCPFCRLCDKAEEALLGVYLDGALMDPGWRGRILEQWLCRRHLLGMQRQARKLGGAIIAQALLRKAMGLLADGVDGDLPAWGSTCAACRDLEGTLVHHAGIYIHEWLADPAFRRRAGTADAFCLPHLALLFRQAAHIPRRQRVEFQAALVDFESKALAPLMDRVDWFVRKFDARFQDEPWQGAEDAVERALELLT